MLIKIFHLVSQGDFFYKKLYDTFRHPIHFKSFFDEVEFGKHNIHKGLYLWSFQDDVVSIFAKHLVDQWRSRINLYIMESIFFFEIQKIFVQSIDFGKQTFFDLIFVQNHTQLSKRRIAIRLSKDIVLFIKLLFTKSTCVADAVLIRIKGLNDKIGSSMFDKGLIQKIEVSFCTGVVRDV
jgi:hypothetical protein